MQSIRILLYTDFSFISANPASPWSVSNLLRFTSLKTKPLADVSFTVINRHAVGGVNRLDSATLKEFEELWIFGFMDITDPPYGLDAKELKALADWMDGGGGMLITGDHSITRRKEECAADHNTFLGHGRSLGSQIRRAGQLRVWEGPPTACKDVALPLRDNFNTQEGTDPNVLDNPALESDSQPQTLVDGPIAHPLFFWHCDNGQRVSITKFPDHAHEGKLAKLEKLDDEWPKESPLPVVVAWGRDKRFPCEPRYYELVSTYDGARVDVGRIVADTSFHHYLDMNLVGLNGIDCCGNPIPGTDLDQISQYYANLALWLTPKPVRREMKFDLVFQAVTHPGVLEIWGTGTRQLAEAAARVLQLGVGTSNLIRLFSASTQEEERNKLDDFLAWIFLQEDSSRFGLLDPYVVLGSTVKAFHNFLEEKNIYDPGLLPKPPRLEDLILNGLELARSDGVPGTEYLIDELRPIFS